MKLVQKTFEAFCDEYSIKDDEAKNAIRAVFYAGALAMFMLLSDKKKKNILTRVMIAREMKEFQDGK